MSQPARDTGVSDLQSVSDEVFLAELERRFGRGARVVVERSAEIVEDADPWKDRPGSFSLQEDAAYIALGWSIDRLTDAASTWAYRAKQDPIPERRLATAAALLVVEIDRSST